MIVYEVKLICPDTQKILFTATDKKVIFPPAQLFDRHPKPLLVIDTKDGSHQRQEK